MIHCILQFDILTVKPKPDYTSFPGKATIAFHRKLFLTAIHLILHTSPHSTIHFILYRRDYLKLIKHCGAQNSSKLYSTHVEVIFIDK